MNTAEARNMMYKAIEFKIGKDGENQEYVNNPILFKIPNTTTTYRFDCELEYKTGTTNPVSKYILMKFDSNSEDLKKDDHGNKITNVYIEGVDYPLEQNAPVPGIYEKSGEYIIKEENVIGTMRLTFYHGLLEMTDTGKPYTGTLNEVTHNIVEDSFREKLKKYTYTGVYEYVYPVEE